MSDGARHTLAELLQEAELSALGARDLHARAVRKELTRTPDQVIRYGDRASRAEGIASLLKLLAPHEDDLRRFLQERSAR